MVVHQEGGYKEEAYMKNSYCHQKSIETGINIRDVKHVCIKRVPFTIR
jgi:hypothetical protein